MSALELTRIVKRFGTFVAVDGLDLTVASGEVIGFLGPNGAGKTTTIRMVMSILHPDSGAISVLGHPDAAEVKDRIGYLPEERGLYRKMSVGATLQYFGHLKGLSGSELSRRADESLASVGLSEWKRKPVEALSKGMSQKLQFVAALIHRPEFVILDEPFSGLDPINTELLKRLFQELRQRGTTLIFSTHQMEHAERLCDRVVLINRGRKLLDGGVSEIRERFSTRIVLVEGEGDFRPLAALPGAADAEIAGGRARLRLTDGLEPHTVLQRAMETARVTRFEVQRPDLHDIFVRLVQEDSQARGLSVPASLAKPAPALPRGANVE
ncbi:MAG: Vitamin B12 import ATP-binding protein BtuD [Phycisphaerae bacterium]|nr:Vitamin B12 import ATP-binding protein BtuD [Phycisphaerae bacterium]